MHKIIVPRRPIETVYRGFRGKANEVAVMRGTPKGSLADLDPRNDLRDHSPDGFNWGYGGSGPAQTALAICADFYGDEIALEIYQRFKFVFLSGLMDDQWEITGGQIEAWRRSLPETASPENT